MKILHNKRAFRRLVLAGMLTATVGSHAALPPQVPPMPALPSPLPTDSVQMADPNSVPEVKLDLPIASGPFQPTWESIEKNY
ncbi:MAG: hypothetical protein JF615_10955, partial [Asticcacaulis sp.]|nr:hypothetical protein [Asticcacaulis sp.]